MVQIRERWKQVAPVKTFLSTSCRRRLRVQCRPPLSRLEVAITLGDVLGPASIWEGHKEAAVDRGMDASQRF